jgi:hypothetical protein
MLDQHLHFAPLKLQFLFPLGITTCFAKQLIELRDNVFGRARDFIYLNAVSAAQHHFLIHHQIRKCFAVGFPKTLESPVDLCPGPPPILIHGWTTCAAPDLRHRFKLHHDPNKLPDNKA